MYRQDQIANIIDNQRELFLQKGVFVNREALVQVPIVESFATIITGIRRGGKSTLMHQLINNRYPDSIFLNFEDIRLAGFDTSDFTRLYHEIVLRGIKILCFDELQLILL
jgi:hypothetical protein